MILHELLDRFSSIMKEMPQTEQGQTFGGRRGVMGPFQLETIDKFVHGSQRNNEGGRNTEGSIVDDRLFEERMLDNGPDGRLDHARVFVVGDGSGQDLVVVVVVR